MSARVRWSPRRSRSWCPGTTRPGQALPEPAPTGWTGFLRWQEVVGPAIDPGRANAAQPLAQAPSEVPPALPLRPEHELAPEPPRSDG